MTFKVLSLSFSTKKRDDDGRFEGALRVNKGDITRWFVDGSSDAIIYGIPNLVESVKTAGAECLNEDVMACVMSFGNGVDICCSLSAHKINKGDITQWLVDGFSDAIVNSANEGILGGGGCDGAIHRAAGPELREACYKFPEIGPGIRCPTGEARITPGFKLLASHVIHTVGPVYGLDRNPEASLRSAYTNSLRLAKANNIQYIAFPAISCGVYRYPHGEAAKTAISTVKEFVNDFKEVHFVLYTDDIYSVWLKAAKELLEA